MDQGFPAMTLYSQKSQSRTTEARARISSPAPHAKASSSNQLVTDPSMAHVLGPSSRTYPLLASEHNPYPHESAAPAVLHDPPRYPESSQRTHPQHHHDLPISNFPYHSAPSAYIDDLPSDFPVMPGSISRQDPNLSRPRYPPVADPTADASYPPNFNTPFSANVHSPETPYHLPPMNVQLATEQPSVLDYRSSLRAYHDLQFNNDPYRRPSFEQPLRLPHNVRNLHPTTQDRGLYSDAQSVLSIAPRRPSDDLLQNSPSLSQQRQHPHQHLTPLVYKSSTLSAGNSASYPSSSGGSHRNSHLTSTHSKDSRSAATTYDASASSSYRTSSHASSSIPMSNGHAHSNANTNTNTNDNIYANRTIDKGAQNLDRDDRAQFNSNYSSRNSTIDLYSTTSLPTSIEGSRFDRPQHPTDPRSKSAPEDTLRVPFASQQQNFPNLPSISPYQSGNSSDNDSSLDSDHLAREDDEYHDRYGQLIPSTTGTTTVKKKRDGDAKRTSNASSSSSMIAFEMHKGKRNTMDRGEEVGEESGNGAAEGDSAEGPVKKKKKSKMHTCEVCGKKFPRPSGLKTHMNTHNNEKPFACGFPGCTRTFGVRSNAKRHLRTHGVQPTVSTASDSQPLYVVGFEPPVVLPSQTNENNSTETSSAALSKSSNGEEVRPPASAYEREVVRLSEQRSPRLFKLKWMPLSLTSRTNVESLREAEESEEYQHGSSWPLHAQSQSQSQSQSQQGASWSGGGAGVKKEHEDEEEEDSEYQERRMGGLRLRTRKDDADDAEDIENVAMDQGHDARGPYSDMAVAARLSIPLRPVYPSSSLAGSDSTCRCNPKCAGSSSGSSQCPSSSSSSFGTHSSLTSLRISSSSSSSSASLLGSNLKRKLSFSELDRDLSPSAGYVEERNSYMEVGSHPYHPSQFRGLPGPASTNATIPSRAYMMV